MIERLCKECSRSFPQYNTAQTLCQVCSYNKYFKPAKPIKKRGKRTILYERWKYDTAIPFLDETFGHKCERCGATENLDVDHIRTRGSRPDLKMDLSNVRYLCRPCHQLRT